MWERHLQSMYQQWCQGNNGYLYRYLDFVELVASQNNMNSDNVLQELQNYSWFKRPNNY
jgi:hypothetical protein